MKKLLFILCLIAQAPLPAAETVDAAPWNSPDPYYDDDSGRAVPLWPGYASPMAALQQSRYDLRIVGGQALGTITLAGSALVAYPEPLPLFGPEVAVIDIIESDNALLLAGEGAYAVYPQQAGMFLLMLAVSIPVADIDGRPRLEFEVPAAVRNELVLDAPDNLRLLESERLHKVGARYFFSPTRFLDLGFEALGRSLEEADRGERLLVRHDTAAAGPDI